MASTAARYWRTRVTVPSLVHRDDGHRARVVDDEAVEGPAVGIEQVDPADPEQPGRRTSSSETRRNPVGTGLR